MYAKAFRQKNKLVSGAGKEATMKKSFVVLTILVVSFGFGFSQNCIAQPEAMPPLLTQQAPAPVPAAPGPPAIPPAAPGTRPGPPATPPLPGPGIPVVQTVAPQALQANLPIAIATARKLGKQLEPGKVWMMRGPAGEVEIKAGILYQGIAVAVLRFNPLSGDVLPRASMPILSRATSRFRRLKPVCRM